MSEKPNISAACYPEYIVPVEEYIAQLEAALELIADVGTDYDGHRKVNGLMDLIDEMVGYARNPEKAYNLLRGKD